MQSGRTTRVCILPGRSGTGLGYALGHQGPDGVVLDSVPIRAALANATNRARCICLEEAGTIMTNVEHLNAVFVVLGVDNALAVLHKPGRWRRVFRRQALPLLTDGTAGFIDAIEAAGLADQDAPRHERTVTHPYEQRDPKRGDYAAVAPGPGLRITCTAGYESLGIPEATCAIEVTPDAFTEEVSRARTLMNQGARIPWDLVRLGASVAYPRYGIGSGISDETMLIARRDRPVPDARYGSAAEELVRHKIIDFLGALALVGPVNNCHFTVVKSSHRHDLSFMRGLAYRLQAAPAVASV